MTGILVLLINDVIEYKWLLKVHSGKQVTVKTTLNENAVLVRKKKSLVSFGFSFFFNKAEIELTGQEL